jgi:putative FmdB family regulatory protein
MPTYQYLCRDCGHQLEELQSMSEPPLTKCPRCGKDTLARVMGSGSGVIFKGSGFYLTDYGKKVEKKSPSKEAPKDQPETSGTEKPATTESKPAPPPASDSKKE